MLRRLANPIARVCLAATLTALSVPARVAGQNEPPLSAFTKLVVNVPAARLDVWHEGEIVRSYPVAVGARGFPTPFGEFELREITWNPWWVPPASDWARDEKATPPGARNPMGRVKLQFSDYYYLHGTADTRSIGRAASHGCVRMRNEDALELARFLVTTTAVLVAPVLLDSLERDHKRTYRAPLDCKVPVVVRYDLAEVRDTILELYPDVYRRSLSLGDEARAALLRAGYMPADIDLPRLDSILDARSPAARKIPLRSIVRSYDRRP
jgi:murein L,D-transpeptidase YcbB/YkuD